MSELAGKCCGCVAHHRDHDKGVPGCFFFKEAEGTYDRAQKFWQRSMAYGIDSCCGG